MNNPREQFQILALQLFGELGGAQRTENDGAALAQRFQQMVEEFKSACRDAESR